MQQQDMFRCIRTFLENAGFDLLIRLCERSKLRIHRQDMYQFIRNSIEMPAIDRPRKLGDERKIRMKATWKAWCIRNLIKSCAKNGNGGQKKQEK